MIIRERAQPARRAEGCTTEAQHPRQRRGVGPSATHPRYACACPPARARRREGRSALRTRTGRVSWRSPWYSNDQRYGRTRVAHVLGMLALKPLSTRDPSHTYTHATVVEHLSRKCTGVRTRQTLHTKTQRTSHRCNCLGGSVHASPLHQPLTIPGLNMLNTSTATRRHDLNVPCKL